MITRSISNKALALGYLLKHFPGKRQKNDQRMAMNVLTVIRDEAFLETALEDGILAEQCQRAARGSCMTGVKMPMVTDYRTHRKGRAYRFDRFMTAKKNIGTVPYAYRNRILPSAEGRRSDAAKKNSRIFVGCHICRAGRSSPTSTRRIKESFGCLCGFDIHALERLAG